MIAALAIETTGLDPEQHVPLEVALATYDGLARRQEWILTTGLPVDNLREMCGELAERHERAGIWGRQTGADVHVPAERLDTELQWAFAASPPVLLHTNADWLRRWLQVWAPGFAAKVHSIVDLNNLAIAETVSSHYPGHWRGDAPGALAKAERWIEFWRKYCDS